ncbi:MAG: DUF2156 domain-containing protein [Deltaproteobacteria bacterium]|nr:DUF2156 domain-containing protein [Candidatus Zymogenaceae bacterium]
MSPIFPEFKSLELSDRQVITEFLDRYRPRISELTFTNLFIWRSYFRWEWSVLDDRLVIISPGRKGDSFALAPIGDPPRAQVTRSVLAYLGGERGATLPTVQRADRRLVDELSSAGDFSVQETREHFDYVYATKDLIDLAGRKYHAKRNYINRFRAEYEFSYESLNETHIAACLALAGEWCRVRKCCDDLGLLGEYKAVREALTHYSDLSLLGGVITIDGKIRAFTLAEALNAETAVVHVEKADPDIRGLYAMINREFCAHALSGFDWVNREQDLADEGLRKAKESYYPERLEEKYRVGLK